MSELTTLFTNIAAAIREKGGTTAQIQAAQFPTAIANLPSGGGTIVTGKVTNTTGASISNPAALTVPQLVGCENAIIIWDGTYGLGSPGVSGKSYMALMISLNDGAYKSGGLIYQGSDGSISLRTFGIGGSNGLYNKTTGKIGLSGKYGDWYIEIPAGGAYLYYGW